MFYLKKSSISSFILNTLYRIIIGVVLMFAPALIISFCINLYKSYDNTFYICYVILIALYLLRHSFVIYQGGKLYLNETTFIDRKTNKIDCNKICNLHITQQSFDPLAKHIKFNVPFIMIANKLECITFNYDNITVNICVFNQKKFINNIETHVNKIKCNPYYLQICDQDIYNCAEKSFDNIQKKNSKTEKSVSILFSTELIFAICTIGFVKIVILQIILLLLCSLSAIIIFNIIMTKTQKNINDYKALKKKTALFNSIKYSNYSQSEIDKIINDMLSS